MGRLRGKVDRLSSLLPDPQGVADGQVVTTQSYVDERGITQYSYSLTPASSGGGQASIQFKYNGTNLGSSGTVDTYNVVSSWATFARVGNVVTLTIPTPITSPLTTKGDLWGFSTLDVRVPVGSNGTVLTADSTQATGVRWATAAASGILTINTISPTGGGNFTIASADGSVTITGATNAIDLSVAQKKRGPGCIFSNGGLLLSGTLASEIEVPYAFAGTGWTIVGDAAGSASIVVSHSTYAAYNTMTTLFTATASSVIKNQATGLSFSLAAGDIIRFSGSGFTGFTRCSIQLDGTPS